MNELAHWRISMAGTRMARFALPMIVVFAATSVLICPARAQDLTTLYSFTGGADGSTPVGPVIRGPAGSLYGAADGSPYGVIYMVTATGSETVLHHFAGPPDGAYPMGGLLLDSDSKFDGVTSGGGSGINCFGGSAGCGTIFRIDTKGKESVLYSFRGGADGASPPAGLVQDTAGNLYGSTQLGGDAACFNGYGCGVVFKLDTGGKETVLHTFTGGADGAFPLGSLIQDNRGNLFGTASTGGDLSCNPPSGCGVVFKLDANGQETVLHAFAGSTDGASPAANLIKDTEGNFYGTTEYGGIGSCSYGGQSGCGIIFKIAKQNDTESVLYSFMGEPDGAFPISGLLRDSAGNLYGTTLHGGTDYCGGCSAGFGVIFELDNTGKETVLYEFHAVGDSAYPAAGLILESDGKLAGTTEGGDDTGSLGTVFTFTP